MANNLIVKSTNKNSKDFATGEVVHRDVYFFTCTKCHKSRRQSLKESRAGELVCRKCRRSNSIPGQTSIFNPDGLPECPKCQAIMSPIWENNGFDGEEGPRHDEVTGYQCSYCGHAEK